MKLRHLLLLGVLASFTQTGNADADPPACARWVNFVDPCWGVVAQDVCNSPNSWTPNQWINFNNWNYSSSADDACEKLVMKYNPELLPTKAGNPYPGPNGQTFAECYADTDLDDVVNYGEIWTWRMELQPVPVDDCCYRTPKSSNPYANISFSGASYGGQFPGDATTGLKSQIYAKNQMTFGLVGTNLLGSDLGKAKGDAADTLIWKPTSRYLAQGPDDADATPSSPTWHETMPYRGETKPVANIDHIIPRIDSKGCACGTNSPANALIISGPLNSSMRNSCLDERRLQILRDHTDGPPL